MYHRHVNIFDEISPMSDRLFGQTFTYGIKSSTKSSDSADTKNEDKPFSAILGGGTGSTTSVARLSRSPARQYRTLGDERPSSRSPLPPEKRKSSKEGRGIVPRLGNESHLKQKIQALEDTVAEYERQKFNVMGTFAEYRERVAERERKLEAEYSSKIITLSEDVLAAKKDFEERMKQFQALQEKFEREKESALEKLRQEHQKEIHSLEERASEAQLLNLEQKYIIEIQRLEEERKSLKSEKEKLGEAFESKLRRAQTLYETELNAAKCLYTKELEAFHGHEEALKDELIGRQEEFKDRLEGLQQLQHTSKEELAKCKKEVAELEQRLQQKEAEIQIISNQLKGAREDNDEALARMRSAESELQVTKQRCQEQEEQLLRKSDVLNVLEMAKNKLEIVVQELQVELKSLKSKVTFLENERQNLESQSQTQVQLQNSQLQTLEMVLDNVSKEKETVKDQYEQQLENERITFEEREYSIKKEYTNKLNEMEKQHKIFQENVEQKLADERTKVEKNLRVEFESETAKLLADKQELQEQLGKLRNIENGMHEHCDLLENHKEELELLKMDLEKTLKQKLQQELEKQREPNEATLTNEQTVTDVNQENESEVVSTLRSTIEELTTKIKALEECNAEELQSKLFDTESENEKLSEEVKQLKKELEQYGASEATKKVEDDVLPVAGLEMKTSLDNMENVIEQKEHQLESLNQQMKRLTDELEQVNKDLSQKTQEILHIRNETKEYIRRREQQQSKAHKREIEKLKEAHQNSLKIHSEMQENLKKEVESLQQKLTETPNSSENNVESASNEAEELRSELTKKNLEILKLQEEKQNLESELQNSKVAISEHVKESRDPRSVLSSPIGSMDSLKKRDSISSVGSAKDAPMCRKAANMSIINKWHCLVDQIKSGDQRRDSKSSSTSSISKLTKSQTHSHPHPHKHQESQEPSDSTNKQQKPLEVDSLGDFSDRLSRSGKSPAPGVLKPQESRRDGKSPARSPVPKPKTPLPISKRPAWRL